MLTMVIELDNMTRTVELLRSPDGSRQFPATSCCDLKEQHPNTKSGGYLNSYAILDHQETHCYDIIIYMWLLCICWSAIVKSNWWNWPLYLGLTDGKLWHSFPKLFLSNCFYCCFSWISLVLCHGTGVYWIDPNGGCNMDSFQVECDFEDGKCATCIDTAKMVSQVTTVFG